MRQVNDTCVGARAALSTKSRYYCCFLFLFAIGETYTIRLQVFFVH